MGRPRSCDAFRDVTTTGMLLVNGPSSLAL
jgi:hypothetical protein